MALYFLLGALGVFTIIGVLYQISMPRQGDTIDQLDAQRIDLVSQSCAQEDGWIADLEGLKADQEANLAILRSLPPTIVNLDSRGAAIISIGTAERTLAKLYARRDAKGDRRQTAANHFEGRM